MANSLNSRSSRTKVVIAGAGGRMGKMLIEATLIDAECELHAALEQPGSPAVGRIPGDVDSHAGAASGQSPLLIGSDLDRALQGADCLIDFTRPAGTLTHLAACRRHKVAMVIGTTGFEAEGKAALQAGAREIPIVFAPNMAVGVNLVFKLLDTASRILAQGYDIEIVEAHHRHKIDAPSGTALRMGEVVAGALGRDIRECAIYGREGVTGERDPSTIGFATVRGGDIVGDHTVMFCGTGERVEISHKASSRMPYALGALRAAKFLRGRQAGIFDMQDVLGLK